MLIYDRPPPARTIDLGYGVPGAGCGVVAARTGPDAALEFQALHDPLTGLPNRVLLERGVADALRRAEAGRSVAAAFVDIDQFKMVNDSLGHLAGDELLVAVADRLRTELRSATVYRFGGDEFVVLWEGVANAADAQRLADAVGLAVEAPLTVQGRPVYVTVGAGIAISGTGATSRTMLRDADVAMHGAKARGPSSTEIFDERLRRQCRRTLEIEEALRGVCERGELRLEFQPVVALSDERTVGWEALLRWSHRDLGEVPPREFVPIAERCGLIAPIGAWVLREALDRLACWRSAGLADEELWMAINVSPHQLTRGALWSRVAGALETTGVPPHLLHLEINESVLADEVERTSGALCRLHVLGVRVVLDGFGTRCFSLRNLRELPVSALKLDPTFVRGLPRDPRDTSLVRSIASLARHFGLGLVAVGIERDDQLQELRAAGCHYGQGALWSMALDPSEATRWLADPPVARPAGPRAAFANC